MAPAVSKVNAENIIVDNLPKDINILGLDSSLSRPGFCKLTFKNGSIMDVNTFVVDNKTKERVKKTRGEKLANIYREGLKQMTFDNDLPTVYVREHAFISQRGQNEMAIFEAVGLEDWYLWITKNVEWIEAYPTSIKTLLTGNRKADKNEVAAAVKKYIDHEFKYDDESDAAAVCLYFLIKNNMIKEVGDD